MSTVPTNPMYEIIRNWQRVATETVAQWKTRAQTLRTTWYSRFYGPQPTPTAMIRPLMRLRGMGGQGGALQRITPVSQGRVIPHASQPGHEKYDFTYMGPSTTPPFSTQKRLGLEKEPYDFTY